MTTGCAHVAARYAHQMPCVPCETCKAWIDRDGSLMDADTARQRYPEHVANINSTAARWHPAPIRPAQAAGQFMAGAGMAARSLLWLIILVPILCVLLFFTFTLLKLAVSGG